MKATVVVTCYNHAPYLPACLDSILAQQINFPCDIVVADDCSTDHTVAILQDYQIRYPGRIQLILREKNLGHQRHYLETHRTVSGDIIFEFDGDDVMLPGKLQQQYDIFLQDPAVNLVFHRAEYFSDDGAYSACTGMPILNAQRRLTSFSNFLPRVARKEGAQRRAACDHVWETASDRTRRKVENHTTLTFNYQDLALWGTVAVHGSYAYRRSSRKLWEPGCEFMEWLFAMDSLMPQGKGVYLNQVLMRYRCNPAGHGSYLSTQSGRAKAYGIVLGNVLDFFEKYPALRTQLYANCLVTTLAMLRARCGYLPQMPGFLWRNKKYLRIKNCVAAAKMRLRVAPTRRIR